MIEIAGHQYTVGKLDARRQFHVVRRLAPILAGLGEATVKALQNGKKPSFEVIAQPIADKLAKMSNEDVDYVLTSCLSVCSRLVNGEPALVQAPKTDLLMFPDITMEVMLKLMIAVIEENMGDFFTLAQPELKTD